MAAVVDECKASTQQLAVALKAGDFDGANKVAKSIKRLLIRLSITSVDFVASDNRVAELGAAINALEHFIVLAVRTADDDAFGRYFAQLRSYYAMTSPENTPGQPKVLGLNLLRLLVDNRLAEFHSELELVPEGYEESPFVQFPVNLERSMMEGMYKNVLQARQNFPDELFAEYLSPLEDAVRDKISQCAAASYTSLTLEAAQKLFNFSAREELIEYCEDFEDWTVDEGRILFPEKQEVKVTREDIPSRDTVKEVLSFASRLERIV